MGDKCKAKEFMKKAGVPVTPGSDGPVTNDEDAISIANEIGYPVIIKAKAGGGGRGMRIVHNDASLKTGLNLLKTEAANSFGDPDLYIEKYISNARHIEIQIIGDENGNIIHLGEPDENFFFIEMNTRIQVEHPVTEMVTGISLVEEQINIAQGEKLTISQ